MGKNGIKRRRKKGRKKRGGEGSEFAPDENM